MTFLCPLMIAVALAQEPPAAQAPAKQEPVKADQTISHYTLGPQDLVKITVFDEPDLSASYRVESDGVITFPLINKVAAAGLTLTELQDRIRTMLANGYIRNPQVRVEIEQYKSQFVIVGGEVRAPGRIPMSGAMTLPEALAAAGSPTASASNEVIVTHAKKANADGTMPDKQPDSLHVNLKELQLGRAGQDVALQDGDTIFVPKAETFYVLGQVRNPGMKVYDGGMTIEQAVAVAGGYTERGSDRSFDVVRLFDGKPRAMTLHKDDRVQANDTITVKNRIF